MGSVKLLKREVGYGAQAIEILSSCLEEAKAGRVVELMLVVGTDDGKFKTEYTASHDLVSLVGHLECAKIKVIERMRVR